jgi:hypothetical protein
MDRYHIGLKKGCEHEQIILAVDQAGEGRLPGLVCGRKFDQQAKTSTFNFRLLITNLPLSCSSESIKNTTHLHTITFQTPSFLQTMYIHQAILRIQGKRNGKYTHRKPYDRPSSSSLRSSASSETNTTRRRTLFGSLTYTAQPKKFNGRYSITTRTITR